jgi:CheY-like chemotaxis protein/two-component sensor histidine kinase
VRKIARDLRIFSRSEEDVRTVVDIERVLESALRMAWNEVRHRAQLVRDFRPVPPVEANESRLGQVFLNLVMNAAQAIAEGAADRNHIRVGTREDARGWVLVEISDTGAGMAPEVLEQLFTPFFTTKPVGVGTGLGLAICQRLVGAIGGEITVESALGRGTTFRVFLPPARAEAGEVARRTGPVPEVEPARRRGRVLVIDDEVMVAAAVRRAIEGEHDVATLNSAVDALQRITGGERFDVILCDLMMPVMTGMDLHAELSRLEPGQAAQMIFLTGGAFTAKARAFLDQVPNPRLEKPFDLANLRVLVNERIPPR